MQLSTPCRRRWAVGSPYCATATICSTVPTERHRPAATVAPQNDTVIAQAKLSRPAEYVSLCPNDRDLLATISNGTAEVWRLDRLWDRIEFTPAPVALPGLKVNCIAWGPASLYVGTASGELACVDPATGAPFGIGADAEGHPHPNIALTSNEGRPVTAMACNASFVAVSLVGGAMQLYSHGATEVPVTLLHESALPADDGHMVYAKFERFQHLEGDRATLLAGTSQGAILLVHFDGVGLEVQPHTPPPASPAGSARSHKSHTPRHTDHGEHHDGGEADDGEERPSLPSISANGMMETAPLASYHYGRVTALAPLVDGQHVASAGIDGSVRLWDCAQGVLAGKCHLQGAQLALAAAPTRPLLAAGSDAGVLRLISTTDTTAPAIIFRAKVTASPLTHLLFNADSTMLFAVSKESRCYFFALGKAEAVEPRMLGYVQLADGVQDIACPRYSQGGDEHDTLLVTLPHSGVLALQPPAVEAASDHFEFTPESLEAKVVRLEMPALRAVAVAQDNMGTYRYGMIYALCADRAVHKFHLPEDNSAWAGLKGRVTKSSVRVRRPPRCFDAAALLTQTSISA